MTEQAADFRSACKAATRSASLGTKQCGKGKKRYLFNHKTLAKVFRAKVLAGIEAAGLALPDRYPGKWVVERAGRGQYLIRRRGYW